ncbi:hypothetical protein ACFPP7_16580, partial [Polaromonas jejuensis]
IADSWDTIATVTQDASAGCPPSPGTLSAMNVESLSAISGMRRRHIADTQPADVNVGYGASISDSPLSAVSLIRSPL